MIVLDASVLIGLHSSQDAHHSWCLDFFNQTLDQELVMPALTYAETLAQPARLNRTKQFLRNLAGLELAIEAIDAEDAVGLAEMRATTALRMPDAVVLYTAVKLQAALATCDDQLARLAKDHGVVVHTP